MLDDLDYIARFDSEDALAVIGGQPQYLSYKEFKFDAPNVQVDNVVLTGMGGSALAGLICRSWWDSELQVPFVVTRGYELPAFVGKNTLVIASSYSGNTEETLAAAKVAKQKGATVICITSGGKLQDFAQTNNFPCLKIPEGYQPRLAVWFSVRLLAEVFEQLGLVKSAVQALEDAQKNLEASVAQYAAPSETAKNRAKQLAEQLMGKAIWVYGGPTLAAAAYKWKINFNENAKNIASWNELPELNHNEIVGWTSHPIEKPFAVIELQSSFDNERVKKRFELTNKLLSGKMPVPTEIQAEDTTKIEQLLSTILLGDYVSVYLAVLNGVNPSKVEIIEKLKKELS